jgi:hypothetical protein
MRKATASGSELRSSRRTVGKFLATGTYSGDFTINKLPAYVNLLLIRRQAQQQTEKTVLHVSYQT